MAVEGWEVATNQRSEAARVDAAEKEAVKQKLLSHLQSISGKKIDIGALCKKYKVPLTIVGEHGEEYDKTEEELRKDLEYQIELGRYSAWYAANQAAQATTSLEIRTLLNAEGISTSTNSISLTEDDLMPIREGWGPSLCGMFAGRFPGKDAVYSIVDRWNVPTRVAFHRKGWISFSFVSTSDMERVREKGPFSVISIQLILEPMLEYFDLKAKMKLNIPVWIRIPDLPLPLWNK